MSSQFLDVGGVIVPASALALPRAAQLARALGSGRLAYVTLVECRTRTAAGGAAEEVVVFDAELQRPQRPRHPIQRVERIAAVFSAADDFYPEVLALRADFPKVPHLNLRADEFPRSLCLYDQPWEQVALRWTATAFVERVRFWLTETARGTLHQTDQPLEPLLFGNGYRIVLPSDLFAAGAGTGTEHLEVRFVGRAEDARVLVANRPPEGNAKGRPALDYLALTFCAEPQSHGIIRRSPRNLAELDALVAPVGVQLVQTLRKSVQEWKESGWVDKHLVLVIAFPLTRDGHATVESTDVWCFFSASTIREVGLAIGAWEARGDKLAWVMIPEPGMDGRAVGLDVMSPVFDLTRETAAAASGVAADSRKAVAVGVGALGSQVVDSLARSGFGRWTLVDEDRLLPHNLARHSLGRNAVGHPKALGVAITLSGLYLQDEGIGWLPADVLDPEKHAEKLSEAFGAAELIVDMAASVPVSRHLAHDAKSPARRVSLFLNPRGTDLVALAEDAKREVALDAVEMSYLKAVATDAALDSHLAPPEGRLRYSRSCRDVSASIPNHLVTLHAAIGARAVREAVAGDGATARVWRTNPETMEVGRVVVPVSRAHRASIRGWSLVIDDDLLRRMDGLRRAKLPNETGGVLIGAYDLARRIVYAVDTVPSPPDSRERPTLYIRGCEGLAARVDEIGRRTDGQLEYVGEWHSHPDGHTCEPSDKDVNVFAWITAHMGDAGLPALMAIAGQGGQSRWFLDEISAAVDGTCGG